MSGNFNPSDSGRPRRRPLIAVFALVLLFLAGVSVWLVLHFTGQPELNRAEAEVPATAVVTPQPAGPDLRGRVMAADGTPVGGATVFVVLPGRSNLRIRNGKIAYEDLGNEKLTHVTTGSDGEYDLPAQSGTFLIAAIADGGFAELDQDAVAKNADLTLTKWGRIQGRLMVGTKPGAGAELQAQSDGVVSDKTPVQISMVNRAKTDANGNFTMERVIPGNVQIAQNVEEQSGASSMIFRSDLGGGQVLAGQIATINLGGVGRPVVGKFVFPATLKPSDYFINARAFLQQGHGSTRPQYFLAVDDQHNFRIDDVPPGNYSVHVFLQKVHGDRAAQPEQAEFTVPDVSGGVSDEPLTIPDIQLQ
jgi:hypothetical protein